MNLTNHHYSHLQKHIKLFYYDFLTSTAIQYQNICEFDSVIVSYFLQSIGDKILDYQKNLLLIQNTDKLFLICKSTTYLV